MNLNLSTMDENFNSIFLRFKNAHEDHSYNEFSGFQMVRLEENIMERDSRSDLVDVNSTTANYRNEEISQNVTLNRSTATWTGSKSSVAIIYPCYLCNYETNRSTSLVAHLRQHRQGNCTLEAERFQIGKFDCDICSFKTRWLSSLKEHEERAHFNNNINSNSSLNMINNRSKEFPYNCRWCGYCTEKLGAIENHMKHHFNTNNIFGNIINNFPCCLCEFSSTQLDDIKNHFNSTHLIQKEDVDESSRASCNGSEELFCSPDTTITDLYEIEESNVTDFPCDYCSHRSATIHLWRDHMESHGGVLEISLASVHH